MSYREEILTSLKICYNTCLRDKTLGKFTKKKLRSAITTELENVEKSLHASKAGDLTTSINNHFEALKTILNGEHTSSIRHTLNCLEKIVYSSGFSQYLQSEEENEAFFFEIIIFGFKGSMSIWNEKNSYIDVIKFLTALIVSEQQYLAGNEIFCVLRYLICYYCHIWKSNDDDPNALQFIFMHLRKIVESIIKRAEFSLNNSDLSFDIEKYNIETAKRMQILSEVMNGSSLQPPRIYPFKSDLNRVKSFIKSPAQTDLFYLLTMIHTMLKYRTNDPKETSRYPSKCIPVFSGILLQIFIEMVTENIVKMEFIENILEEIVASFIKMRDDVEPVVLDRIIDCVLDISTLRITICSYQVKQFFELVIFPQLDTKTSNPQTTYSILTKLDCKYYDNVTMLTLYARYDCSLIYSDVFETLFNKICKIAGYFEDVTQNSTVVAEMKKNAHLACIIIFNFMFGITSLIVKSKGSKKESTNEELSLERMELESNQTQELLERKKKKESLQEAINLLSNPPGDVKKALKILQEKHTIGSNYIDVAAFFLSVDWIEHIILGCYLGGHHDSNTETLKAFLQLLSFEGEDLLVALKRFLSYFFLPGESQIIDRVIEAFSNKFYNDNPNSKLMKNSNDALLLAYGIIVLTSRTFGAAIDESSRMTRQDFFNNYDEQTGKDGYDLTEYLSYLFDNVTSHPLRIYTEKNILRPLIHPELKSQLAPETLDFIEDRKYDNFDPVLLVPAILDVIWKPLVATCNIMIHQTSTFDVGMRTLMIVRYGSYISSVFSKYVECDSFLNILVNVIIPKRRNGKKRVGQGNPILNWKNNLSAFSLVCVAQEDMSYLSHHWNVIFMGLSVIESLELDASQSFVSFKAKEVYKYFSLKFIDQLMAEEKQFGSLFKNVYVSSLADPEADKIQQRELLEKARDEMVKIYDNFLTSTSCLPIHTMENLLKEVVKLSLKQEFCMNSSPIMLSKIIFIVQYNLNRPSEEWILLWNVLRSYFIEIVQLDDCKMVSLAVATLYQLVLKLLELGLKSSDSVYINILLSTLPDLVLLAHNEDTVNLLVDCFFSLLKSNQTLMNYSLVMSLSLIKNLINWSESSQIVTKIEECFRMIALIPSDLQTDRFCDLAETMVRVFTDTKSSPIVCRLALKHMKFIFDSLVDAIVAACSNTNIEIGDFIQARANNLQYMFSRMCDIAHNSQLSISFLLLTKNYYEYLEKLLYTIPVIRSRLISISNDFDVIFWKLIVDKAFQFLYSSFNNQKILHSDEFLDSNNDEKAHDQAAPPVVNDRLSTSSKELTSFIQRIFPVIIQANSNNQVGNSMVKDFLDNDNRDNHDDCKDLQHQHVFIPLQYFYKSLLKLYFSNLSYSPFRSVLTNLMIRLCRILIKNDCPESLAIVCRETSVFLFAQESSQNKECWTQYDHPLQGQEKCMCIIESSKFILIFCDVFRFEPFSLIDREYLSADFVFNLQLTGNGLKIIEDQISLIPYSTFIIKTFLLNFRPLEKFWNQKSLYSESFSLSLLFGKSLITFWNYFMLLRRYFYQILLVLDSNSFHQHPRSCDSSKPTNILNLRSIYCMITEILIRTVNFITDEGFVDIQRFTLISELFSDFGNFHQRHNIYENSHSGNLLDVKHGLFGELHCHQMIENCLQILFEHISSLDTVGFSAWVQKCTKDILLVSKYAKNKLLREKTHSILSRMLEVS